MATNCLNIVEIIQRSEQGVTRPFLCRCEDDRLYYVKGRGAGPRSLLCEWFAGYLARALELPVPAFAIVQAQKELVDLFPDGNDLGTAPAFGSVVFEHTQELSRAHVDKVPVAVQRKVLVFDWWIHNADRTLTTISGNPNLLWNTDADELVAIDHNVAFDREFDAGTFSKMHVFSGQIPFVFHDLVERVQFSNRLHEILAVWPEACQNVPPEWWFMDGEQTVPADFDPDAVLALLNRCTNEDFWKLAP